MPQTAIAGPLGEDNARFASGDGYTIYLAAGIALPILTDGDEGIDHATRTLDAVMASYLLSEGIKTFTEERRPDGSDHRSFPSTHATVAFALATAESEWHPKQAPLWYLGAAIIADSRLELNSHRLGDVLVGAALGYCTTKWALSRPHGIILTPFIEPDSGCVGIQVTATF